MVLCSHKIALSSCSREMANNRTLARRRRAFSPLTVVMLAVTLVAFMGVPLSSTGAADAADPVESVEANRRGYTSYGEPPVAVGTSEEYVNSSELAGSRDKGNAEAEEEAAEVETDVQPSSVTIDTEERAAPSQVQVQQERMEEADDAPKPVPVRSAVPSTVAKRQQARHRVIGTAVIAAVVAALLWKFSRRRSGAPREGGENENGGEEK